jgi:hypothetical protein
MSKGLSAGLAWLLLACLPLAATAAPPVLLPVLVVRVLPGTDPSILADLLYVRRAQGPEPVTLQFDLARHRVLDGGGRVVAGPGAARPEDLQSVVDKWRYVAALGALAQAHPQEVRSEPAAAAPGSAGAGAADAEENFVVLHVSAQRQLLVFSIGPSGHLYFLPAQPRASGPDAGDTQVAPLVSMPPFGAEHIVAVTAADPQGMQQLGVWLREVEEGGGPGLIDTQGELLKQIAALRDVRVGLVASYSCSKDTPECR